ncbi:TRAP transporter substrate-binding protein [Desulfobacula toluolica]|uniref:DctP8: predicted TRAP dicarboxylate transporter periplasmic binding protein n=1 Tax=Desulfobacula toluolica (strain DSM 7467 / Tol2) TaxID=651182 RepID=K0NG52_DESTT|nr:TRAP transporter substrate-binding protein [Desulfobacula toluolica]CCK79910.1 DctP8: predicted TRAP dicarboxylate transporter periplasmic binding protein [Desulfobacula toluolica Tol2]
MKNFMCFRIALIVFCAFFFSSILYAKPIKLTYSNFFPPTHVQSKLAQGWCDEVKKRTDGKVVVEYYPGGTLSKSKQVYDGVVVGLSDVGLALFAYTRGRFPVLEAADLPLGYTSGVQATKVVNELYDELKPKELSDTRVMYLHAHGAGLLHTKGKAVRTMADFQGMKLRGHGTSAMVINALGGTPVSLPMPELYSSLQKNIVQGAMYPIETNKGWRMGEVTDFLTMSTSIAYTSSFYVVMNKRKWNSIPADLQEIISQINKEWIVKHGQAWDESDKTGLAYFKSLGHEVIELSDAESEKWKNAIEPVIDQYVEKMNKKGFDGRKIVDFVKKSMEKNR